MKTTRIIHAILPMLVLLAGQAFGQITTTNAPEAATNAAPATNAPPSAMENEPEKKWAFSVSVQSFHVPDDRDFVQPTLTADRDWLHLEARYNYEALETGSTWVGWNLSGGKQLQWAFTPMIGAVFGDLTGVAPGYEGTLTWWKLELFSEGEYVFDPGDSSGNFFYNWSELSLYPVEWFRFGLVTQRTHVYQTDRDIQRGLLVGVTWKKLDLTTYVLNADRKPTVMVALTFNF